MRPRSAVIVALGVSQTLAWASSYYLPAILADPIAKGLGFSRAWVFAAFSMSLLIAALAGPRVGRLIDRRGGRGVLVLSNIVLAIGLVALASASGVVTMFAAWAVLGVGMALGLYDAGFATLAALYGRAARGPITGITLFAGFASTVSWPLSALLNDALGWRETCLVWAVLNLVVGLPLNRLVLPAIAGPLHAQLAHAASIGWKPYREMFLLAFVFAAAWFVTGAMAAHLPGLLERAGATTARGRRRRSAGWAGTGRGAARRVFCIAPGTPADVGPDRRSIASDWCRHLRAHRRRRSCGVRSPLWRRERTAHDCAWHRPTRFVWSARLWRTHRPPGRAGPRRPGICTVAVRAASGRRGRVGPACLGRPLSRCTLCALLLTSQTACMSGRFLPVLGGMMSSGLITIEKSRSCCSTTRANPEREQNLFSLSIHRDQRCRPRPLWVRS